MRYLIAAILSLSLIAIPAATAAPGDTIATGHIEAGGPHTAAFTVAEVAGEEEVDAFFFDAPAAGTFITTETVDNSGLGYDLDLYFFDAAGDFVGSCASEASDEICEVPDGAVEGEVAAFLGVDLDVTVIETADPSA